MTPLYHDRIPNASGIYRITCTTTGKIYIGSALNLYSRKSNHFHALRHNTHKNPKLQSAWNKYGEDVFTFEVLEFVLPMSLTAREQYWLNKLNPFDKNGFNLAPIAGSSLGRVYSPESCKRISEAKRGKPLLSKRGIKKSPEAIENHRRALTGYKHTEEAKRNMGKSHLGSKHSLETRDKIRLAALGHAPTNDVKPALVIAPDGTEYVVESLRAFCREHPEYHLKANNLGNVARGTRKQYKGWKARYID